MQNRRRSLAQSLDGSDDDSLPATKRQKINHKDNYNDTPSMLTIPICYDRKRPLAYVPFWICGNSTDTILHKPSQLHHVLYPPAEFLNSTQYPFLRVCNIPKNLILALDTLNFGDRFYSGDIYKYSHPLSLKYQTSKFNTNDLTKFINFKVDAFHKQKDTYTVNYIHTEDLFTYLFIMKEHYTKFYNEFVSNNKSSLLQMLTDDITQFTLTDFIYETRVAKDINYLNDNQQIDQHKWFQFAFHFIESASYEWQEFFYQTLLHNNSEYYETIINAMKRNAFIACRLFECAKLVEFCIEIYPQTGNKFRPSAINDFVIHSIKLNDVHLFQIALDLFDSVKPGLFWGSLLFQVVRNIKYESLTFFNKICIKMKVHCNEMDKMIKDSLNKFNQKSADVIILECSFFWKDAQLNCVEMMKNILGYDVNTIIPHCVSKNNFGFIQYLMEEDVLDYNTCKNNGYLDEINKLNARFERNSGFENVLNDFISKYSAKK